MPKRGCARLGRQLAIYLAPPSERAFGTFGNRRRSGRYQKAKRARLDLPPLLADLIVSDQSTASVRPWLGMTLAEADGRLVVLRVTPEGPAERAGIKRGDIVHAVKDARPSSLEEFYRAIWAQGAAGTVVDFELLQDGRVRQMNVPSIDRRNHLKLRSTL
jgi:S1-C subfamily serine protease